MAQDDEPTLMYAFGVMEEDASSTLSPLQAPPHIRNCDVIDDDAPPRQLEVVEVKVFAAFDAAEDRDPKRWVLDTGATNHMTGSRGAFSDLDTGIVGTVCFGDGSVVKIEGRGTVLFACKNGEHRTLANTYFIPWLTTNIISVG